MNTEKTMRKQLRFWDLSPQCEPVLIKIKAGQTLHHGSAGTDDEGWSSYVTSWTFDGRDLVSEWRADGRDCDGRYSRTGKARCHAAYAKAGNVWTEAPESGIRFPLWEDCGGAQRDYSAEAAGY